MTIEPSRPLRKKGFTSPKLNSDFILPVFQHVFLLVRPQKPLALCHNIFFDKMICSRSSVRIELIQLNLDILVCPKFRILFNSGIDILRQKRCEPRKCDIVRRVGNRETSLFKCQFDHAQSPKDRINRGWPDVQS